MKKTTSRRGFLGRTLAVGGGLAAPAIFPAGFLGAQAPSEKILTGHIGLGGMGTGHLNFFRKYAGALCDVDTSHLNRAARIIGRYVPKYRDFRDLLDQKNLDGVLIATPDHWHGVMAVMACEAGKDVYVEKPFSHNIWEGRKLVEAVRKYKRVVQVGTQNRSAPYNLAAREYIQSGKLGDVRLVKVFNLKGGGPFRLGTSGDAPKGFSWTTWLGSAKARPYHSKIFHGGWHYFWDYSGGDLADCGIHQLDLALMVMGDPAAPGAVSASGGRLQHRGDDAEVPDVEILQYDFPGFVLTFEHSHFANAMSKINGGIRAGDRFPHWPQCATRIEFYGTKDNMMLGRHGGGWQVFASNGRVVDQQYGRHPDLEHQQNFVDCIRSRDLPNADVGLAQVTTSVMHMGNIAHRVGNQKLQFDAKSEKFVDDEAANRLAKRQNVNEFSVTEPV